MNGLDSPPSQQKSEHNFVVVLHRSAGSMRHSYLMVDEERRCLAPKVARLSWPRLQDLVDFRACVLNNCIYITGGRLKGRRKYLRSVLKYDAHKNRWTECAEMKQKRGRHACVALAGKVYVIGGCVSDAEVTDHVESYEPLLDEWTAEDKLPEPRVDLSAVVRDDVILTSGGSKCLGPHYAGTSTFWEMRRILVSRKKSTESVYMWHNVKNEDASNISLTHCLAHHNSALARGKLYLLAGVTDRTNIADEAHKTSQETRLQTKPAFCTSKIIQGFRFPKKRPPPKQKPKSKEKGGRHRGKKEPEVEPPPPPDPWVHRYPKMPEGRCSAGTVTVGNKIYLVGGHSAENNEKTSINSVIYFHAKRETWENAFSLTERDFSDVECHMLTVPTTNIDIRPFKYKDCKWVMW